MAAAAGVALLFRPWAVLRVQELRNAWFAAVVLLTCLWSAQSMLPASLPSQFSGACLLVLMFGWPLAVLTMLGVALAAAGLLGEAWITAVQDAAWLGALPATLALAIGLALRRWLPRHVFVFILGRGFLGTAIAMSLAGGLHIVSLVHPRGADLTALFMADWLMAWGEAFMTGALVAVFVAFRPGWLLTWSDDRYLPGKSKIDP